MIDGEHARSSWTSASPVRRHGWGRSPARRAAAGGVLDIAVDSDDVTRAAATIAGEVVGTIEYMAPEQARGEHVDQRADIYAFGLMVYDMLTGRRRAEHAASAVGELQQRLAQAPPPVRSLVPEVPQALEQLVTRCTEPDAAKRFQTTAELVEAIERLDDNGKLRPMKRVVRLPLAVAVGAAAADAVGLHLVVPRGRRSARPGLGRHRGLPEQHQGSGVRRHARTDAQARAGRGELHHGVRPRRHPAAAGGADCPSGSMRPRRGRLPSSRGSASCSPARSIPRAAAIESRSTRRRR